jgi:predicted NACHT family NTPase
MERAIRASEDGLKIAQKALQSKGCTQGTLADLSGCTRQTIAKFLARNKIDKTIFQNISKALDLEWENIAELDFNEPIRQDLSLDEIVENVRINVYDNIQAKCGSMRVLDMSQPIDLNEIYTDVKILDNITARERLGVKELIQDCSLENFERLSLGKVQEERMTALNAVDKYAKLMILGKPGSGKTTFLKYVALQCIEGQFRPDMIPLFITLKDFAEKIDQPSLLEYLIQLFKDYGVESETKIRAGFLSTIVRGEVNPVEYLLRKGRVFILLDGLDEIKGTDDIRILKQIQDFAHHFPKNLFVITCRIAAKEYALEQFTEVEVANFDRNQIDAFVNSWFQIKNDPIKANTFITKSQRNSRIQELATNPLLLTLLCLVFEESGNFPLNRSELYKEGLDILLKKWDAKRNIDRDQVYQKLSLKRKEDLLSQIALDTFDQGNYFLKKEIAEKYITQYIRNLPEANTDENALQLDSEAVLKSIEAQHGLFVERAREIYSFSHLTFHEYFTARKIIKSTNSSSLLKKLATHIGEKRWREVSLLTVEMLDNADYLLQDMKQEVDCILADPKLQKFLSWIEEKSVSVEASYGLTAVRSFYLSLYFDRDLSLFRDLSSNPNLSSNNNSALAQDLFLDRDLDLYHDFAHNLYRTLSRTFSRPRALALSRGSSGIRASALKRASVLDRDFFVLIKVFEKYENPLLKEALQQSHNQLPNTSQGNWKEFARWWQVNGQNWTEELRTILIENRNISHKWQFSKAQKELIQKYYAANRLLIACLNSDCYVSLNVKEEIKTNLLLPISRSNL